MLTEMTGELPHIYRPAPHSKKEGKKKTNPKLQPIR